MTPIPKRHPRALRTADAVRRANTRLVTLLAVSLAVLAMARPEAAPPGDLFFSEYVEGSSNNKALEIFNGTAGTIDLAAGGYTVQMFFNGSGSAGLTIELSGIVAAGDAFVLAHSSATAAILALADQTAGGGWFNGDDAVVLRRGSEVLDSIGQVGFDPGTEWGAGDASTADNTLRRLSSFCGDTNGADVFVPSAQWSGFATDTFAGLGAHTAVDCLDGDAAPSVSGIVPGNGASGVDAAANVVVTFSEPVALANPWFTLICDGGAVAATASSGPGSAFTIDPANDFAPGARCSVRVLAAAIADVDAIDPPDSLTQDFVSSFTVSATNPCASSHTPIPAIQGADRTAAITGVVSTRGIVVGDYEVPTTSGIRGFYIQDAAGDGDPATSDGIFVFSPGANRVNVGDDVVVTGRAGEFEGQTQISEVSAFARCGSGTVDPIDVQLPFLSADSPERYEGMLVRLPQTLTVTEHFQLGRFGQVVMSSNGRLRQPTDVVEPGPAATTMQAANDLNRLIVDDGTNLQNPDPIVFGRGTSPLSASNTLRAGDTAAGIVGVMTYTWAGNSAGGNAYRVRPVGALGGSIAFLPANPRPTSAPAVSGTLRVASMNLLNFFNTFSNCTNGAGGEPTDCRGAESQLEFDRQWPKTVAAIVGTRADVIGIIEIENDGYGSASAIQALVERLNAATAPGTYAFVDADAGTGQLNALGTDAIKVGLLYKPARVLPIGVTAVLNTADFVNGGDAAPRNRPSLAQAFEEIATGGRFVVDVNHLKSKGSDCDAPDAGDGQGACNGVRTTAASILATWLQGDPTGVADPDVLLLGDLNAYGKEDPVSLLTQSGYTNLVDAFGGGHSYVFDGQWGSLDHALATTSLRPQVTGAADWFINADEPSVLDYNTNFKSAGQVTSLYSADWFRMADHNPLLVDLALDASVYGDAKVTGGGHLLLSSSAGEGAGDSGTTMEFSLNGRYKKHGAAPDGNASVTLRSSVSGTLRTYQIKTRAISSLLRDPEAKQATLIARAIIVDVTDRSAPVVLDSSATLRVAVTDNGEPGAGNDTIGVTVWGDDGALWFSSAWTQGQTALSRITGGNIQVH